MVDEDGRFFMRIRSTKNVISDIDEGDSLKVNKLQKSRPDKPCHKIRDSLFSSSSDTIDETGFMNLFMVLLVSTATHTALESIMKHGVLYDPVKYFKTFFCNPTGSPSSLVLLGLNVFPLSSLGIEILLSKGLLSENAGLKIIIALLASEIVIPSTILYFSDCHVFAAFIIMFCVSAVFLKLVSYHMTNFWCREAHDLTQELHQRSSSSITRRDIGNGNVGTNLVHYPDNLNFKDLYYFLCLPTLCYELNFPRSPCIRKTFLVKRLLEMMVLVQLILCLTQQCIGPTMNSCLKHFQENAYGRVLEIVLKLAVPHTLVFLMGFYCCYHSYFNTVAEILRFGDRHFYEDFWNSETTVDYWQEWNVPVHKWCIRHLYSPLKHCGFTSYHCSTAVFFISAVFHEFILIIALKMSRCWSFTFMLLQVPLEFFVEKYFHNWYGNVAMSIVVVNIFPLFSLMCYHDYYVIN